MPRRPWAHAATTECSCLRVNHELTLDVDGHENPTVPDHAFPIVSDHPETIVSAWSKSVGSSWPSTPSTAACDGFDLTTETEVAFAARLPCERGQNIRNVVDEFQRGSNISQVQSCTYACRGSNLPYHSSNICLAESTTYLTHGSNPLSCPPFSLRESSFAGPIRRHIGCMSFLSAGIKP